MLFYLDVNLIVNEIQKVRLLENILTQKCLVMNKFPIK
jgi:hypothetical protein